MNGSMVSLAFDFAWRDLHSRYRSSFLGWGWVILNPLVTLTMYTLVFSGILGVRLSKSQSGLTDYAVSLWAGMIVFTFFSNIASDASTLISGHANYVKKVVFPLPVFVFSKIIAEFVTLSVNAALLCILLLLKHGGIPVTALLLPLFLMPTVFFCCGIAFILSALGVYFSDTKEIVRPVLQALFYLSPVVYPLSQIPEPYRRWMWFNPVTPMVQPVREIMVDGKFPGWQTFLIFSLSSAALWALGVYFFSKVRRGFSDVL